MITSPVARSIALAVVCLLATKLPSSAQTSITVPDFSFSTDNSSSSYANQYPVSYSPYPDAIIFPDWVSSSYNYQIYQVSTSGSSGTFNGSTAVEVAYPQTSTTESLNPVVAHIDNNAIYTLTFSLSASRYITGYIGNNPLYSLTPNAGAVTLQLLSTTSAPDMTDYSSNVKGGSNPTSEPNPAPIITTTATLATTTISGATIDLQGAGVYQDYTLTFDTKNGDNASAVGQDMSIAISIQGGNNTDFDNVRLTELVPEPSTYAMIGLGLAALLGIGKFRKLTA